MFDHVTIGASDRGESRRFYALVLGALEREPTTDDATLVEWGDFSIAQAGDDRPVTTGLHVGFSAPSPEHLERFWHAGVDAGFRDDGASGPRPQYGDDYLGAFLLDPDGNSAEAVWHDDLRQGGIDHLWIRVADRAASKRFQDAIAPLAGFSEVADLPDRTRYTRGRGQGSFSIVDGAPTTPFHVAYAVPDRETVARFHEAATAAGYTDHGPPGVRPEYHPGYFGAFVLDPDGHNVEAVHHTRPR